MKMCIELIEPAIFVWISSRMGRKFPKKRGIQLTRNVTVEPMFNNKNKLILMTL
jgi:hypothetical protein